MRCAPWDRLGIGVVSALVIFASCSAAMAQNPDASKSASPGPGKKYALIVGVNYRKPAYDKAGIPEPDRSKVPLLHNAVNDAKELAETLRSFFGYSGADQITLLTEEQATKDNIISALQKWCQPGGNAANAEEPSSTLRPNDSLLVFFAGHGTRWSDLGVDLASDESRAVVYPFDSKFQGETVVPHSVIDVSRDMIRYIRACPATHKLLILDSCHAGEIFYNQPAAGRSDQRSRISASLPCFQGLVSCRAWQRAADGWDKNSPFSTVLLRSMKMIPARQPDAVKRPFTVTELFEQMRPDLYDELSENQFPRLGFLARANDGDGGEFRFYPSDPDQKLANLLDASTESNILRALSMGENGSWWFEETPWLIPSLRKLILEALPGKERAGAVVDRGKLSESARLALEKFEASNAGAEVSSLQALRVGQLRKLFRGVERTSEKSLYADLANEIELVSEKAEAVDLHLLAVLRHSGNQATTRTAYDAAIAAYKKQIEKFSRVPDAPEGSYLDVLLGLCHSDRGVYELVGKNNPQAAIHHFREARESIRKRLKDKIPAPFSIFVLCQEADAWLRLGMPGKANHCMTLAMDLCKTSVGLHPLSAYVHRKHAWLHMDQWQIAAAEREFTASNDILRTFDHFEARIARTHNDHGLAMIARFRGQSDDAVQKYVAVIKTISKEIRDLKQDSTHERDPQSMKSRWCERFANSLERAAEANMLLPENAANIGDAIDDLRRALKITAYLPSTTEADWKTRIQLKLALALSLPSPAQDVELAKGFLDEARNNESFVDSLASLDQIISSIHAVYAAPLGIAKEKAIVGLRKSIISLEREAKSSNNRDQLELLLFASRILVDENESIDRFQTWNDTELLRGLCRRVLSESTTDVRYLRPYFDSAFQAKLKTSPSQVLDLIDIQFQATNGRRFDGEPHSPTPIVAVYFPSQHTNRRKEVDSGFVVVHLPGGYGKVYPTDFSKHDLTAALAVGKKLELPRAVFRDVQSGLRAPAKSGDIELEIRWHDPLLMPPGAHAGDRLNEVFRAFAVVSTLPIMVPERHSVVSHYSAELPPAPFNLPRGFVERPAPQSSPR